MYSSCLPSPLVIESKTYTLVSPEMSNLFNYDEVSNVKLPNNVKLVSYIENMGEVLKFTDLIVTRAGATTMSEIISYKVPSILVPSPYVTDNHQYKNAMSLVSKNAGVLVEESVLEKELIKEVDSLINDKEKINEIRNNLSMMSITNSASKIYDLICEIVGE